RAGLDLLHVDRHGAIDRNAELRGPLCGARDRGARDEGLRGDAAGVDAGSADLSALDDRALHAGAGETRGEGGPGLAAADDDRVVGVAHWLSLQLSRHMRFKTAPLRG